MTNQRMMPIGTPVVVNIQGSLVRGLVYNYYTVRDITDYAIQIQEDFVIGEIQVFSGATVRAPQQLVTKKGI